MTKSRMYKIEWDNQGKNCGMWWQSHRTLTLEAYNREDARERFNDWYDHHGPINDRGNLRHPFHIKITRAE